MIARTAAWCVVAAICYGVWVAGSAYKSPWNLPVSPVLSKLPPSAPGCGEDCKP